jgi:hypothetical protein
MRLDPFRLPARIMNAGGTAVSAVIDRYHATLVRRSAEGQATRQVPIASYRGVAVRILTDGGEMGGAVVELMHDDPSLSVALLAAEEPEDVAADWQAWARALNLPLLLVGHDGTVQTAAGRPGDLLLLRPKPRRRHSFFAGRRPRFLVRRKVGRRGASERVEGREIIARN